MRSPQLALCLLLAAAPLAAQDEHSDLGFQLGYSRASFSSDVGGLSESRSGSLFGVFVGAPLAGPLSGQAELFLAKKGGGLSAVVNNTPVQVSVQLVYLELPLLARFAIPVGGRLHPNLFGGGAVALNIGCDIQAEIPGVLEQEACDEAGDVSVTTFDLGYVFGAGIEYDWRDSNARIEIRRTIGVRDVTAKDPTQNRAWALLFAITL
jgi:hypothetical protein